MELSIPLIDINDPSLSEEQIALLLVDAAEQHGFIYIKNTGQDIPADEIKRAFSLSRLLFGLPTEEKQKYTIQTNNCGWSGMHSETLDPKTQKKGDFKEAFNFGPFPTNAKTSSDLTQHLPPALESLVPQIAVFQQKCHRLCVRLLALFGIGLAAIPATIFSSAHSPEEVTRSGCILRHLYYPAGVAAPSSVETQEGNREGKDIRAGAHSDYGSITLLFRLPGQPGLEVLLPIKEGETKGEGRWIPVPVLPPGTAEDPAPPILVNIGDLLSYWTGGLFRSTLHRVVFPSEIRDETDTQSPRYSIAYFCHPTGDTRLEPVPSVRVQGHRDKLRKAITEQDKEFPNPWSERKTLTADEHLQMRDRKSVV